MARRRKRQGPPDFRISYLLFGLGALAFAAGAYGAWHGYQTLSWPLAPATIVDVTFTEHESRDRRTDVPERWHTVAVRYRYTVGGREQLGIGTEPYDYNMQSASKAKELQARFPVGAAAEVAYDPQDPSVSYLVPGPSSFSLVLVGIGLACGLVGALARRMIRVGPGDDDQDQPADKKASPLPSVVASFYPPRQP
jgi:hypothetical protein